MQGGRITPAQLAEAKLQQHASGKRIGTLLVELGALDERVLAAEMAAHVGLPVADLRVERPDPAALKAVPEGAARAHTAIPLQISGNRLSVAVADPFDRPGLDALAAAARCILELYIAPRSDIERAIQSSYRAMDDVDQLVEAFEAADPGLGEVAITVELNESAPVVQVVTRLVTQGLRDRASDIHIEPQDDRLRIRFRIDGALHDVVALPRSIGPAIVSRLKIMGSMNIADRRRSQDGQFALTVDERPIDVRVNTCPTVWGEKAVLRLLDRRRVLYRLDDLGMQHDTHARFSSLVRAPYGMILSAGPTGSGKTTTLYATLAEINATERNVTTIEDPVEYVFLSINQIQINEASGITFASGLRAILRQDPDVILVGEIRDAETARIATESALTGHLVLTSLHATDAASALHRLLDMGIEPFLVASTVIGVASQRLIRRTCENCQAPYQPGIEEVAFFEEHRLAGSPTPRPFTRGEGCNFCGATGYRDRIGIFELLDMTEDIKRLVLEKASVDALRASAQASGMRSLLQEGLGLVSTHVTTVSEVMRTLYRGTAE